MYNWSYYYCLFVLQSYLTKTVISTENRHISIIISQENVIYQEDKYTSLTRQNVFKVSNVLCIRSVADNLKMGKIIQPETYSQCSIYFSDIVGFTTIASDSSPMQVSMS